MRLCTEVHRSRGVDDCSSTNELGAPSFVSNSHSSTTRLLFPLCDCFFLFFTDHWIGKVLMTRFILVFRAVASCLLRWTASVHRRVPVWISAGAYVGLTHCFKAKKKRRTLKVSLLTGRKIICRSHSRALHTLQGWWERERERRKWLVPHSQLRKTLTNHFWQPLLCTTAR